MLHAGAERRDGESETDTLREIFGVATTEDYLEKIFQIPFWLRSMQDDTTRLMLNGLLRGEADQAHAGAASRPQPHQNHSATAGPSAGADREPDVDARPQANQPPPTSEPSSTPTAERTKMVESLEVRDFELDCMRDLAPLLGRSPRALKRFVNTYRLTKASLTPSERTAFVRRVNESSDFECVLLLLAIDCGLPALSSVFQEVLRSLYSSDEGNGASARVLNTPGVSKLVSALNRDERTKSSREWQCVKLWLAERRNSSGRELDLVRLAGWTSRVARYSFRAPMS